MWLSFNGGPASLEADSEHPLAQAILKQAEQEQLKLSR